MALVRVYCGLASADATRDSSLAAVVVDDTGRLLNLCDIKDDPSGYAYLSGLLAERAGGQYAVAIASDQERNLVTSLLVTAGWALAFADRGATDDFAQRYTPDLTGGQATPPQRRATGLARALHAGALSAALLPTAPDLANLKPVLSAHGALATGRHAAATALREVLRELYPAALRAYPDPCHPLALAIMDALPEPGALGPPASGRGRETSSTADAVTNQLARSGVADPSTIAEAITALRVAIAETPRRGGLSRGLTATVAETVRQSVAAVRACDAASTTLMSALADRVSQPVPAADGPPPVPAASANGARAGATMGGPAHAQASAPPATHLPAPPRPPSAPPAGPPSAPPAGPPSAPRSGPPLTPLPRRSRSRGRDEAPASPAQAAQTGAAAPVRDPRPVSPSGTGRPVSVPPPPPPGIAPIAEPRAPLPVRRPAQPEPSSGNGADHLLRVPGPRPAPGTPPPGSRSDWPTQPPADDWAPPAENGGPPDPWRPADPPPPEQPSLRLVEPTLPEELRGELGYSSWPDPPSLRLVEPSDNGVPRSAPPVTANADDDDLLIFAQTRSAWFTGDGGEASWNSSMDVGWRAAEQAAHPEVNERTGAGLPRRVPHANLVPGSPPSSTERPLRIVRDPNTIAANTSGYFNGYRRGLEIGGFPLGGRPGRQAAGAWDFSRDTAS